MWLRPVYMDENCRQYGGTNPLCTRLHDDPAKCRSIFYILFRLGTLRSPMHCPLHQKFKMAAVVECSRCDFGPGEGTVAVCGIGGFQSPSGQWGSPIGSWVFVNFFVFLKYVKE
ncbi:hypothetical protein TNCV_3916641 [Trichonephila clavipes]|nr:hypothetical protein TNCV_3916641 [Trichonephila clavipes]